MDDLARMVSGIDWNEAGSVSAGGERSPVNDAAEMLFAAQDAAAFVGGLPQNATPGVYFNYSTGNYQLLQYNLRCAIQAHYFDRRQSVGRCMNHQCSDM